MASTLQLRVCVNASAVGQGITPGWQEVEVDLATLTPEDRDLLARFIKTGGGRPPFEFAPSYVDGTTPADVIEACKARVAAEQAAERARAAYVAQQRQQRDNDIAAFLAAPEWGKFPGYALDSLAKDDPRRPLLLASMERVQAEHDAGEVAEAEALLARVKAGEILYAKSRPAGCCDRAQELYTEIFRLHDANVKARDAAIAAARDAWLREKGEATLADKLAAGYDCSRAVRAVIEASLGEAIREACAVDSKIQPAADTAADELKSRSCPSDTAFEAEKAAKTLANVNDAAVMWGVWESEDEVTGEVTKTGREVLVVKALDPWTPNDGETLSFELIGTGFSK